MAAVGNNLTTLNTFVIGQNLAHVATLKKNLPLCFSYLACKNIGLNLPSLTNLTESPFIMESVLRVHKTFSAFSKGSSREYKSHSCFLET